ncbi:MAG: rhodanese-like domain-containing protein [Thiovulaceae bacterium]|nr:rhodanese-like domain-containing protein [Sulfurimonadaceae bacterium]
MRKVIVSLLAVLAFAPNSYALHIEGVQTMLNEAQLMVTEIDPKDLKTKLDSDDDFFLIDLRETAQQEHGEIYHIDSFKITRGYLEFQVEEKIPDKKAKIIVYCCSGKRSLLAAKSLIRMGYKDVLSLKGGIKEWVSKGMPLDTVYGEMIMKKD